MRRLALKFERELPGKEVFVVDDIAEAIPHVRGIDRDGLDLFVGQGDHGIGPVCAGGGELVEQRTVEAHAEATSRPRPVEHDGRLAAGNAEYKGRRDEKPQDIALSAVSESLRARLQP